MKQVCVFAGSRSGNDPAYLEGARKLGEEMGVQGIDLVYGGSLAGLMGELANTVLSHNRKVIGIMPSGLFSVEIAHKGLSEFIEVADMHERKAKMGELSDGFIALPGGLGTFEELFEVMSWLQIGIHSKPIGLLNINGYYDPLIEMINHSIQAGFVYSSTENLFVTSSDPNTLLQKMKQFKSPRHFPSCQ